MLSNESNGVQSPQNDIEKHEKQPFHIPLQTASVLQRIVPRSRRFFLSVSLPLYCASRIKLSGSNKKESRGRAISGLKKKKKTKSQLLLSHAYGHSQLCTQEREVMKLRKEYIQRECSNRGVEDFDKVERINNQNDDAQRAKRIYCAASFSSRSNSANMQLDRACAVHVCTNVCFSMLIVRQCKMGIGLLC